MNMSAGQLEPVEQPARPGTRSTSWLWMGLVLLVLVAGACWYISAAFSGKGAPALAVDRRSVEQRDGLYFKAGETVPFSGLMYDYYPDGQAKLRTPVVGGRLSGEAMGWYTNGAVELLEFFENGLPHGPRLCWHPNGQLKSEGQLVQGRQEGVYRQWDEFGALRAEAAFQDGKPHGLSRAWNADGSLKAEAFLENGEVRSRHIYPDNTRQDLHALASEESRWKREQSK